MMRDIQNYCVFGLCLLFGILKTREQKLDLLPFLGELETCTVLGPLERVNLSH
jgi:hypothetical protein